MEDSEEPIAAVQRMLAEVRQQIALLSAQERALVGILAVVRKPANATNNTKE